MNFDVYLPKRRTCSLYLYFPAVVLLFEQIFSVTAHPAAKHGPRMSSHLRISTLTPAAASAAKNKVQHLVFWRRCWYDLDRYTGCHNVPNS